MTARPADQVTGEHQLVLFLAQDPCHHIGLSCTCLGCHGDGRGRVLIAHRAAFPAADAIAAWRSWHEREGIPL